MRPTKWTGSDGIEHEQHVVFQPGDPPPVSKYSGRLKAGEAPPSHVGQPKGVHQVLFERQVVEATLPATEILRSDRETLVLNYLEEEGRIPHNNPDRWNDECGSANKCEGEPFMKGCDDGIVAGDNAKRCLVLCSFCLNAHHPGCAGSSSS